MGTTVWCCGHCGHCNLETSVECEQCGASIVSRGPTVPPAIVTTDTVIESIHIQLRDLANDNRDGKFIVLSHHLYLRLKVEMENYHMCAMFPTECLGMQIIIDTHAEPTMLRVLPSLMDSLGMS